MRDPTSADEIGPCIRALVRPLARILIRNGVSHGAFAELARQPFIDAAQELLEEDGEGPTNALVAVQTGIPRKYVGQIAARTDSSDAEIFHQFDRAAQVVTGWLRDKRFHDKKGRPANLPVKGQGATFKELVRRYSGDVPFNTMKNKLLKMEVITETKAGRLRLLKRGLIPGRDRGELFLVLGENLARHIEAVDHNMTSDDAYFERKVEHDNLPNEALPKLRKLAASKVQSLLEALDKSMARYDRDTTKKAGGTGRKRATLGIYYFDHDYREEP